MGLSGPRKRQKISHDPNNTRWTRDDTSYGHKLMASQGWAPGQTLGPVDAAHAKHHTAASTSHVRIALREDGLGLGAKLGSGQGPGECTGLHSFQDLLGRLNGKTEAVIEKERIGRANVGRMLYAERKYGGWSRFVSAGYLVGGESMQDQLDTTISVDKSRVPRADDGATSITIEEATPVSDKNDNKKKSKKSKKSSDEASENNTKNDTLLVDYNDNDSDMSKTTKRKLEKEEKRAEKAQRKEDRRKRREAKAIRKATDPSDVLPPAKQLIEVEASSTVPPSRATTSGSATPTFSGGRHAVRQRYIMQKKAAMLDAKALNEILMVKV